MSTDSTDKPTPNTVAAVMAQRRKARDASEKRRAEAQERADKRPMRGRGTT